MRPIASLHCAIRLVASCSYLLLAASPSQAQDLPLIFDAFPVERNPAATLAAFPINTFLENLVVDETGRLYITSHEDGKIVRLDPGSAPETHAAIAGKVAGIAFSNDGSLIVSGVDAEGVAAIFQVAVDGGVTTLLSLPEALFLNGITQLSGDLYLVADSYRGAIWEVDIVQRSAQIWLEHPLLARQNPDILIPAVNGLKRFGDTLYVSNTERMSLLKIGISESSQPLSPELWLEGVNVDDFALDSEGNLYGATHIYNSVIRITPEGDITTIAQLEDGVTGSTAVALGQTQNTLKTLYVVTNGGMFLPPPTGVIPAEVVALALDSSP